MSGTNAQRQSNEESGARPSRSWWPVVLWLSVGAFAARVIVSLLWGENTVPYYEYMTIADNLLHGRGYSFDEWSRAPLQPTSFLPPLYVYWCAAFMAWIGNNYVIMYLGQALIAATGCFPAFLVGRELYSPRFGIVFAAAYAFFPEFVYLSSRPVSEFLYVVLVLWLIYLYLRLNRLELTSPRLPRMAFLIGLLGAVAVLVKEATLVFMLMLGAAVLLRRRKWLRTARRVILPMAVGGLLGMSPWIIRNAVVQHQFIPVRTGYGVTMWIANHHGSTGTSRGWDQRDIIYFMDSTYMAGLNARLPVDEQDRDLVYRAEVKRFVHEYPLEYVELCVRRAWFYLWFDATHPIANNLVYRVGYVLLLLLAVPGAVLAWRRRELDPLIPFVYFGYLAFYIPVLVLPRYRIIPVLMLLMMASYLVNKFLEWRTAHHRRLV